MKNKIKAFVAASAAAVALYSANANADNDESEFRLEHRLGHPSAQVQDSEPDFATFTAQGAFFAGISGIDLNHQGVGYGAGGKINLHIGLDSFALSAGSDAMEDKLCLGLELSDMFAANLTGGVYDGFANNVNADLSLSVLNESVGGTAYVGTGLTIIQTFDPWLNEEMSAYGNVHAGGRLLFSRFGSLELEAGGVFNEQDSGFYMALGLGVAFPDIY